MRFYYQEDENRGIVFDSYNNKELFYGFSIKDKELLKKMIKGANKREEQRNCLIVCS